MKVSIVSEFASLFGKLGESVDEIFEEIGNCLSDSEFFKFPKMNRIQIPKGTNKRRTFGTFSYESTLKRKNGYFWLQKYVREKWK